MSVASIGKLKASNSSSRRLSTKDSIQSKKSRCSGSITSVYGSKFGRTISKFPKQNDPGLVYSVSVVNSRVIRTLINFPIKINSKLPNLMYTEATDCIRELGDFFDILDYEFNYATFWLLDILSKIIKHMQLKKFSALSQNITLTWFRYVLRLISINGTPREEIFCQLKEMFLKAEEYIRTGNSIPQPEDINVEDGKSSKHSSKDLGSLLSSKSLPSITSRQSRKTISQKSKPSRQSSLVSNTSKRKRSSKSSKSNGKSISNEEKMEENLQTLKSIIEIIYGVFADRFVFSLISEAYSSPTIIVPMDIPLDFKEPKQLRPTLVLTPPVSPKSKKLSVTKSGKKGKDKGKGKGKEKEKSSPVPKDETGAGDKTEDEDDKKSKKGKSKEKGKTGGGSLSSPQEEENGTKSKTKEKGKGKGGKSKDKKSKSSDDIDKLQDQKDNIDSKNTKSKITKLEKSNSLKGIKEIKIRSSEEKLKLFDRPISPDMKLEMKKIEVKDKFILPLSEGVNKDYVENLIKSILPPEAKPTENVDKSEQKLRKSSSLKSKKK